MVGRSRNNAVVPRLQQLYKFKMVDEASVKHLLSWSGNWDLPSADVGCLQVLAYAKFAGCPLKVEKCNNPLKSPSWQLPVLKSDDKLVTSPNKIMDHLREKNFNADYYLTAKQGADTLAFTALVQDKLYPAILYTMWMDSKNYTELTRPWYAGVLPLPLNWIVPGRIASHVRHVLTEDCVEYDDDSVESKVLFIKEDDGKVASWLHSHVYKNALECFTLLSEYLGENEFFFGESPTTLDAVVFAHLSVILKVPLPNNRLKNQLHSYDNLVLFASRILQRYFPLEPEDGQAKQKTPSPHPAQDDSLDEHETRNKWLWAGFVIVAMTTYACFTGIVKLKFLNKDTREEEDSEQLPDMAAFSFLDGDDDGYDEGDE